MIRRSSTRNQRNRRTRHNILEVSVRAELAKSQRNRMIMRWTLRILAVVAIVGAGVYGVREGLRRFLWENPEYNLAVIEVINDGQGLTRDVILNTAGLEVGVNIFSVNLSAARDALTDLPQVEHVEVRRILPQKITIDLTERRPVAWLAAGDALDPSTTEASFLVDAKGILFKPKRVLPEYLHLPVITGVPTGNFMAGETIRLPEVQAALELIRLTGYSSRFQVQSIDLSKGYCMVVSDIQKKQVVFPLDEIDRHLERLAAVLDYGTANRKEIQSVNLMVERNIPITLVSYTPSAPEKEENSAVPAGKDVTAASDSAKVPPPAKASSAAPAKAPKPSSKPTPSKKSKDFSDLPVKKAVPVKSYRQEELRKAFSR